MPDYMLEIFDRMHKEAEKLRQRLQIELIAYLPNANGDYALNVLDENAPPFTRVALPDGL
jgi:hypothetical protein